MKEMKNDLNKDLARMKEIEDSLKDISEFEKTTSNEKEIIDINKRGFANQLESQYDMDRLEKLVEYRKTNPVKFEADPVTPEPKKNFLKTLLNIFK